MHTRNETQLKKEREKTTKNRKYAEESRERMRTTIDNDDDKRKHIFHIVCVPYLLLLLLLLFKIRVVCTKGRMLVLGTFNNRIHDATSILFCFEKFECSIWLATHIALISIPIVFKRNCFRFSECSFRFRLVRTHSLGSQLCLCFHNCSISDLSSNKRILYECHTDRLTVEHTKCFEM